MKKYVFALLGLTLCCVSMAIAQTNKNSNTNTNKKGDKVEKEIIIEERKDGREEKMVIVVDGEKITINGKPASEYKGKKHIVIDDDVIIHGHGAMAPSKRKMTIASTGGKPRAFLGVVTEKTDKGAKITEVVGESAAEKAGLKEGDIITQVGTTAIAGSDDLISTIGKMKPEEVADITYERAGKQQKIKATLGKSEQPMVWNSNDEFMREFDYEFKMEPPMAMAMPRGRNFPFSGGDFYAYGNDRPKYGMGVEDNADGDGAKVSNVEPESNAAKAGLKEKDIITGINGKDIKTVDELREELAESRDKSSVELKVLRNGKTENLTIRVPKRIKTADL